MNFNPESGKKEPKSTTKKEAESKELFLSPEKIRSIYKKGRMYLLSTIVSLGFSYGGNLGDAPKEKDKGINQKDVYNNFASKFKNINFEQAHEIYDDLSKILKADELKEFSKYDSILEPALLDKETRNNLIELSSLFRVRNNVLDDVEENLKEIRKEKN
ncbi:MAG: hypothetical protein US50_C0021G0003 [Candidatus Nomurabacteria bacterium GW2011_GWB1_37_5]|uniref:Uncharacterized protein n=1 Tax=Candidatus Nomurabacteria bacterium GW2011_GWB1_37_5 TaxID=1618742 RepID=A0A0G0JEL7_9BACT|nr:MAG: hypothetical protein US50_C0021G0003 [Candidatus Nomurabacteria bacterium GW2011_GWB1_37_5]